MKKLILNLLAGLLIILVGWGCSSKYAGFDKTDSGLYYKIYKVSKDTIKPKTGDWVSLNMSYKYKDSLLFDNRQAMGAPIRFKLPLSDFKGDIYEGIKLMSKGDSAEFIINADSLFTKTFQQKRRPPFVDTNSVIRFHVTLLSTDSPESLQKTEDDALKNYLETQKITVPAMPSGMYFIETQAGKGIAIDSGVWVKVHFKVALIDGKQIFSTHDKGEPIAFEFGKRFDTKGFEEGVGKMKKGGKAKFIVPSPLAFGEMGRGAIVPPYSTILYEVEVVDVITKADYDKQQADVKKKEEQKKENAKKDESALLKKYLKDKNITVKPTASGLYYIEKAKGTGPQPTPGKKVKVHYTGTLLNGTKFDSSKDRNQPFEFELGKGQVIKGWDEGVALMNAGGKAILIVPSNIAYGDREIPSIPAYSTLVFEVDLIEVK
jgi:peptidylprolyl isomerase